MLIPNECKKKEKETTIIRRQKKTKLGYLQITYQDSDLKLGQIELNCPKRSLIYRALMFVGNGERSLAV